MSCNKPWDTNFLASQMTKAFINGPLKAAKETVLWEGQLAQMPETQVEIETRRAIYTMEAQIDKIRSRHAKELRPLRDQLLELKGLPPVVRTTRESVVVRKPRKFIKACSGELCHGFLNPNWNCGICEKSTCKDCHAYLSDPDAEHVCNADDIETARLLARDTKSCPQCGVSITKIDGCDQMWCSQCHVSFSWRTNEIVTGSVHNPHYFEWARSQARNGQIPRQAGDGRPAAGCGTPDLGALLRIEAANDDAVGKMSKLCMLSRHVRQVELRKHVHVPKEFLESRIQYLLGRKSKKVLCSELFKDYKAGGKKTETRGILQVFVTVVDELLVGIQNEENVPDNRKALDSIVKYTNENLALVSDIRGGVKHVITEDLSFQWGARVLYDLSTTRATAAQRRYRLRYPY